LYNYSQIDDNQVVKYKIARQHKQVAGQKEVKRCL
jgi:hypothetical protein